MPKLPKKAKLTKRQRLEKLLEELSRTKLPGKK